MPLRAVVVLPLVATMGWPERHEFHGARYAPLPSRRAFERQVFDAKRGWVANGTVNWSPRRRRRMAAAWRGTNRRWVWDVDARVAWVPVGDGAFQLLGREASLAVIRPTRD